MIRTIQTHFVLFLIYSFAGWFLESVGGIINVKKFVNRGFLIGPYCPIYGVGVICFTLLLSQYKNDLVLLFFLSMLIAGVLEYLTSYLMEKIFNARWWDYSKNRFNINGRICLETMIFFGICGCLFLKILNPFFEKWINMIPDLILTIITSIIGIIMFIDFIISTIIILTFKRDFKMNKDNTDEIVGIVKKTTDELSERIQNQTAKLVRTLKLNTLKFAKGIKYRSKFNIRKYSTTEIKILWQRKKQEIEKQIKIDKILLQMKLDKAREDRIAKMKERFEKKSKLHERLLKAFPNFNIGKK
ncbi:MAG: putative ABC transporter permease [Clostridia bacterium]|nr:putative ABC transporter permease [Clostridia bacterium]